MRSLLIVFVLLSLFTAFPASAETVERGSVCYRIIVDFEADKDSVISGQIGIEYSDDERVNLVNVQIGTLNIEEGDRRKVAEIKVNDMRDFRVSLNTDGTIASGAGEYHKHVVGCSVLYINDGRLNIDNLGSLAIIYKNGTTGGYDLYAVNPETGAGRLVIRTTREAVSRALGQATQADGANTLIQASGSISLWALTSNECQMNSFNLDGSLDEFIFDCTGEPQAG